MAAKTTGAEFKRFYNDSAFWLEGVWVDASVISVNGGEQEDYDADRIPDDAKVAILSGVVVGADNDEICAFDTFFRRWLKAQTTRTLNVEVSVEKLEAVIVAIKVAGGKVI